MTRIHAVPRRKVENALQLAPIAVDGRYCCCVLSSCVVITTIVVMVGTHHDKNYDHHHHSQYNNITNTIITTSLQLHQPTTTRTSEPLPRSYRAN